MTDADASFAAAAVRDGIYTRAVAVRCNGSDRYYIVFHFAEYMNDDPIRVRWRFDGDPVSEWSRLEPVTTGTAVFLGESRQPAFIEKLRQASRLTIEGRDYNGTPVFIKIGLAGSGLAIGRLNCVAGDAARRIREPIEAAARDSALAAERQRAKVRADSIMEARKSDPEWARETLAELDQAGAIAPYVIDIRSEGFASAELVLVLDVDWKELPSCSSQIEPILEELYVKWQERHGGKAIQLWLRRSGPPPIAKVSWRRPC